MTLDVLISTFGRNGISRIAATPPPRVDGVGYIISWQSPEGELPAPLKRTDIKVVTLDGQGLSRNRNNAIEVSQADICLIADDDLVYHPEALKALIDAYESRPDMDFALLRVDMPGSKVYPAGEMQLRRGEFPKGYFVQSIEISFRHRSLPVDLRFNPAFGLGAERFLCGEEELFVDDALRRGLHVRFVPLTVVTHPDGATAVSRASLAGVQRAAGAVIMRFHPATAVLRLPLKAWRMSRAGAGAFPRVLWNILSGAFISPFYLRRHGKES